MNLPVPTGDRGGQLTREVVEAAITSIKQYRVQPNVPIYHPSTVASGRLAADHAAGAAWAAWSAEDKLPRWAWLRRSNLRAFGIERARLAESLWATFGIDAEQIW